MASEKTIVALTGAGISAESGLQTFRGAGGLWEGHAVTDVATPEAWERDPEMVLRFYNMRRDQLRTVEPNAAHRALAELQAHHRVSIVTQNIDDLHEQAGSREVLHLHGELMKARSTADPDLLIDLGARNIEKGDVCPLGSQLRPHVVWFGEAVPEIGNAAEIVATADILLIIGTSMLVYPAAGLVEFARPEAEIVVVNPEPPTSINRTHVRFISKAATDGVPAVTRELTP